MITSLDQLQKSKKITKRHWCSCGAGKTVKWNHEKWRLQCSACHKEWRTLEELENGNL